MANAREQMKTIEAELHRIQAEIAKLRIEEETLRRLLAKIEGKGYVAERKRRAPNVKPVVLDIMTKAGEVGATSTEVAEAVKEKVPEVAKDTVGSVLSRLKSDGALIYDGVRYFDSRFRSRSIDVGAGRVN